MTRILVGNDFSEDVRADRGWTGWWVQRLIWFAEPGDVLVLPAPVDEDFFAYAAAAKGFFPADVHVVTPLESLDRPVLTAEVLTDPALRAAIIEAVAGRGVSEILPLWPDPAAARLARDLDLTDALPGAAFMAQAGGIMLNSKSAFRTVAAGAGLPLPEGAVCTSRSAAVAAVVDLLGSHEAVVVKHEWMSGGRGNEILTTRGDVRPIGARRSVEVDCDADIERYFEDRWDWLSAGGRGRPVVEHYFEDSSAYFTEFMITDDGCTFRGDGELLSAPYAVGQIMPAQTLDADVREQMIAYSHTLAAAVQTIGYRGNLGPDVIVTPDQELFFTEWNGRVTGSTHVYNEIGRHVVGARFGVDRILVDQRWPPGWSADSFADVHQRLQAAGLAFSEESGTGVILTTAYDGHGGVMYCIAAASVEGAWDIDHRLADVFRTPRAAAGWLPANEPASQDHSLHTEITNG
jgi:pre ATP-grasp domain-containing protein/pheganomycin biosynthesis PGM1-like protein